MDAALQASCDTVNRCPAFVIPTRCFFTGRCTCGSGCFHGSVPGWHIGLHPRPFWHQVGSHAAHLQAALLHSETVGHQAVKKVRRHQEERVGGWAVC